VLANVAELKVRLARTEANVMLLAGKEIDAQFFDIMAGEISTALALLKTADAIAYKLQQA